MKTFPRQREDYSPYGFTCELRRMARYFPDHRAAAYPFPVRPTWVMDEVGRKFEKQSVGNG